MIHIRPAGHFHQGIAGRFADRVAVIVLKEVEEGLGRGFAGKDAQRTDHRLANVGSDGFGLNNKLLKNLRIVIVEAKGKGGCAGGNGIAAAQKGQQRLDKIVVRPAHRCQGPRHGDLGGG